MNARINNANLSRSTRLVMIAVGGQGNIFAAKVLGEAARITGTPFRSSEIHGMAQRGGVVESSLVFGYRQSYSISRAEADVLLSFEPSETLRALAKCNAETTVVTNLHPRPSISAINGSGAYPDPRLIRRLLQTKVKKVIAVDAYALAVRARQPLSMNMALLGALQRSGCLPFSSRAVLLAIERKSKDGNVASNQAAFKMGIEAAGTQLQCAGNRGKAHKKSK